MKKLLAVGLIILSACLVFFAARSNVSNQDDLEGGEWAMILIETDGKVRPITADEQMKLVFLQGKVIWKLPQPEGEAEMEGTYQTHPEMNPKEIEISQPNNPKKLMPGIYTIEGDRLILCIGSERPTSFSSRGNPPRIVWVFQRN